MTELLKVIRGNELAARLYEHFTPVREAYAKSGMTEDQINAELDAAVRAVRVEQRGKPFDLQEYRELVESSEFPPDIKALFLKMDEV